MVTDVGFTAIEPNLGQNSSLSGYIKPVAEHAFRGTSATQVTIDVTPSLFVNEPEKNVTYTGKSSGYEYIVRTQRIPALLGFLGKNFSDRLM